MSASSPPPLPVLLESGPGSSDGDEVIGSQTWLWCGGHAQISTQRSGPQAPTPAVLRSPCNGAAVSACCLIHAGCWPQGSIAQESACVCVFCHLLSIQQPSAGLPVPRRAKGSTEITGCAPYLGLSPSARPLTGKQRKAEMRTTL